MSCVIKLHGFSAPAIDLGQEPVAGEIVAILTADAEEKAR